MTIATTRRTRWVGVALLTAGAVTLACCSGFG